LKHIDHYVSGGRYEVFRFDSCEEMTKTLAEAGTKLGDVYGKTQYEGPKETGAVWLFIEVFDNEFGVQTREYVLSLKLIKTAKDNAVANNTL
jgi:hypothetical protein